MKLNQICNQLATATLKHGTIVECMTDENNSFVIKAGETYKILDSVTNNTMVTLEKHPLHAFLSTRFRKKDQ